MTRISEYDILYVGGNGILQKRGAFVKIRMKKILKKQPISLKRYCLASIIISLILNFFVYFHAFVALLNIALVIVFIHYFKKLNDEKKVKKIIVITYYVSLLFCNSFSILMGLLLIIAFILAAEGELDFSELVPTVL